MMTDTCKELLLTSLTNFYDKNDEYKSILKSIIDGKHCLSLRMIDWLVTIYAKNNNIIYWISENTNEIYNTLPLITSTTDKYKKINIYLDYRAQLKSFKKINFDSFRRHDRITFILNKDNIIETTIGQLNFFKWAFSNRIITYAIENQKVIYENMSKISYKKINKKNLLKQDILNAKCFVSFN
jgi:hypothetical protein